jgi:hypothetical protein
MRVMPIMVGHSDKAATYASAEQMFLAHVVHTLSRRGTSASSSRSTCTCCRRRTRKRRLREVRRRGAAARLAARHGRVPQEAGDRGVMTPTKGAKSSI